MPTDTERRLREFADYLRADPDCICDGCPRDLEQSLPVVLNDLDAAWREVERLKMTLNMQKVTIGNLQTGKDEAIKAIERTLNCDCLICSECSEELEAASGLKATEDFDWRPVSRSPITVIYSKAINEYIEQTEDLAVRALDLLEGVEHEMPGFLGIKELLADPLAVRLRTEKK